MNNGEKATTNQIKKLYSLVLSRYREKHGIEGGLATDTIKQVMDTFKEKKGITSFATLRKKEISRMIDEIEYPLNKKVAQTKIDKTEDTESEEVKDKEKKEKTPSEVMLEGIAEEMQVAVRAATKIAIEEVQGKIESQGLTSLIQNLATTMFFASRRRREEEFY